MVLNKKEKATLRKMIVDELKMVPNGYKIHLDKELLEELLFDEVVLEEGKEIVAKLPVWSGHFLRKIDLSEVSFDGVCWNKMYFKPDLENKYAKKLSNIDYSYTNARIDFSKSYDVLSRPNDKRIHVTDCNFEGVDLSHNKFGKLHVSFCNSNLKKTKIILKEVKSLSITCSNFEGVDLSFLSVDLEKMLAGYASVALDGSNFAYSGLRIRGDLDSLYCGYLTSFNKAVKSNCLVGCYLNGNLIFSSQSKERTSNFSSQAPAELSSNSAMVNSVITDIVNQIIEIKKKK